MVRNSPVQYIGYQFKVRHLRTIFQKKHRPQSRCMRNLSAIKRNKGGEISNVSGNFIEEPMHVVQHTRLL